MQCYVILNENLIQEFPLPCGQLAETKWYEFVGTNLTFASRFFLMFREKISLACMEAAWKFSVQVQIGLCFLVGAFFFRL